jgi:hypothetical protein
MVSLEDLRRCCSTDTAAGVEALLAGGLNEAAGGEMAGALIPKVDEELQLLEELAGTAGKRRAGSPVCEAVIAATERQQRGLFALRAELAEIADRANGETGPVTGVVRHVLQAVLPHAPVPMLAELTRLDAAARSLTRTDANGSALWEFSCRLRDALPGLDWGAIPVELRSRCGQEVDGLCRSALLQLIAWARESGDAEPVLHALERYFGWRDELNTRAADDDLARQLIDLAAGSPPEMALKLLDRARPLMPPTDEVQRLRHIQADLATGQSQAARLFVKEGPTP